MFPKRIFSLIVLLLIGSQIIFAQSKSFPSFDADKIFQEDLSSKFGREMLSKPDVLPIGNIVNPDYYYVGPGDAISLQNLTVSITQEIIVVTPETSILLPRIGEVSLIGKTLSQVKQIIIDSLKKRNPSTIVYISLYQPRNVLVSFKGDIAKPGTYSLPASYRISTAIKVVNYLQSQNTSQSLQPVPTLIMKDKKREQEKVFSKAGLPPLPIYSSRNISVVHNDGSAESADIEKASAMSNPSFDPYIREGDEIFVPYNKEGFPVISISGAVIRPFSVPFKKGDKASFLLKLGGGFSSDADKQGIYLYNPDDNRKIRLDADSAMNLTGSDIELLPGSSIVVGENSSDNINEFGTVAVTGEVKNPGSYIIKNNETKLKEIIEKAGGFNAEAYLPMAYIMRGAELNYSVVNPGGDYYDNFQRSDLSMEDTARYVIDLNYRKPFVSCDFEALFTGNADKFNVALKSGDVIVIPQNPKTVFVYGQVNNPGYIPFEKNKSMEWYIEKAGGYAINAEKSRARIIRAKNKVWMKSNEKIVIYAGDEIYVPKPMDMPPGVELQSYFLIATAIGTIIQVGYLIITLFRK